MVCSEVEGWTVSHTRPCIGMADVKGKHPSWFKMKLERRELVRQLSPETAVNVLLACWDYLETGEKPFGLSPIENVAFSSFMGGGGSGRSGHAPPNLPEENNRGCCPTE